MINGVNIEALRRSQAEKKHELWQIATILGVIASAPVSPNARESRPTMAVGANDNVEAGPQTLSTSGRIPVRYLSQRAQMVVHALHVAGKPMKAGEINTLMGTLGYKRWENPSISMCGLMSRQPGLSSYVAKVGLNLYEYQTDADAVSE